MEILTDSSLKEILLNDTFIRNVFANNQVDLSSFFLDEFALKNIEKAKSILRGTDCQYHLSDEEVNQLKIKIFQALK